MAVPSFTVNGSRRRLFVQESERSSYQSRAANAAGWKSQWDTYMVPRATTLKNDATYAWIQDDAAHKRMMLVSLVGWLNESSRVGGGYRDRAILAAQFLAGQSGGQPTNNRHRLLALAIAFDMGYGDMTSTERNAIAAEIVQLCGVMAADPFEQMDGWSGLDQMCKLAGALAIYGHSTVASAATTAMNEAMAYLYGDTPNQGRMEMPRYESTDGGKEKGVWYAYRGLWCELWTLWILTKATSYDAFAGETWPQKIWEWLLWGWVGGDLDNWEHMGDTAKVSNPVFQEEIRWAHAILAGKYPNPSGTQGGEILAKLYSLADAYDAGFGESFSFAFVFFDKAAVTATSPKDVSTPPATSRMFKPPGVYWYRKAKRGSGIADWGLDSPARIRISARDRYYLGHAHLDAGSIYADLKGDPVILSPAGTYDDFAGNHHYNAYQRSWLQSFCPLIKDPGASYLRYSQSVVNDGGQQFRRYSGFIAPSKIADPAYVYAMVHDQGGQAWTRCERFDKVSSNSNGEFLLANIREAYKQQYSDPQRCPICEIKYILIHPTAGNGLNWPAILYYARVKKANSSWVATIPVHAPKTIATTAAGFTMLGYFGTSKAWVSVRDKATFNLTVTPPGSPLVNGYGPDQFKIRGVGTNYPPSKVMGTLHQPFIKTYSLWWEKASQALEEHYVCFIALGEQSDSDPIASGTWVSDGAQPDYYAFTIGSETYMLHRTQDLAVIGGAGTPDTTPPAEVSGFSLSAKDRAIVATWTDPVTSDYKEAVVRYRTS